MNVAINVFYIFPIMLALCLMLSMTHYAGIIGGSLGLTNTYMIVICWHTDYLHFYKTFFNKSCDQVSQQLGTKW